MIAYLDSSVLLRVVLGEAGALREWRQVSRPVVSPLLRVESLRTLDRMALTGILDDEGLARRREAVFRFVERCEHIDLDASVLERASQPFPTPLGTLDALHLSSAMLYRDRTMEPIAFATHDLALARAARSAGFVILGA